MKITKRQLRRIINEAISGTAAGPNSGISFLSLVMAAMEEENYEKAANHIMDSLMIDDIFPEDEAQLIAALSALPTARRSPADVEAVADNWAERLRSKDLKAAEEILATRIGSYRGVTLPDGTRVRESRMKITKRQLMRIIRETMDDKPIRMIPGDSFPTDALNSRRSKKPQHSDEFRDTIVMSPTGDTLLVAGQEVALQNVVKELEIQSGQPISAMQAGDINAKLLRQYGQGYVELPISWSPSTGWKF